MAKWTKILPDGKGGFDVWDNWDLTDEFMQNYGMKWFGGLLLAAVFSLFMPVLILFSYPMDSHKGRIANLITALIVSVVMILDFYGGGLLWCWLHSDLLWVFEFAVTVNLSLMVITIFLLVFSNRISPLLEEGVINIFFYLVIISVVYGILYPMLDGLVVGHGATEPAKILEFLYEKLKSFNQ